MTDIETGVPLPPPREPAYPELFTMAVGDSFTRPLEERDAVHYACQYAKRSKGLHFATRTQADGTVRVWRIQ